MIGIDGQFAFGFSIGSMSDFLSMGDLLEFSIIEDAGGVLPTYILSFLIYDDGIIRYLNDGNSLKVSFGQSRDSITNVELTIFSHTIQPHGENCKRVTVIGMLHKPDYLNTAKLVNYGSSKSTLEIIQEVAGRNFTVISNVDRSFSPHLQIQPNISDKAFIAKIWMHTDLKDSFPVMGINVRGEFMIYDMKKLVKAGHKWKLGGDSDGIGISPDYISSSNSGMVNSQYTRKSTTLNLDAGDVAGVLGVSSPFMILSDLIKKGTVPSVREITTLQSPTLNESTLTNGARFSITGISNPVESLQRDLVHPTRDIKYSIPGVRMQYNQWTASYKEIARLKETPLPGVKFTMPGFVNDNVTTKYNDAEANNVNRLANFSSNTLTVTLLPQQYIPISVLDIVMFKQPASAHFHSSEYESGLYVVTKVARTIQHSTLMTTVILSREGMNAQSGDFQ